MNVLVRKNWSLSQLPDAARRLGVVYTEYRQIAIIECNAFTKFKANRSKIMTARAQIYKNINKS